MYRLSYAICLFLVCSISQNSWAAEPQWVGKSLCPNGTEYVRKQLGPDEQITAAEMCIRNGKKHGPYIDYWANGFKHRKTSFVNDVEGETITIYSDETGKRWRQITTRKNGERFQSVWNGNGQLVRQMEYRWGRPCGAYRLWSPNGEPRKATSRELPRLCQPVATGADCAPCESGSFTSYDGNGRRTASGSVKNGRLHGTWTYWSYQGQVWWAGAFSNGKPCGHWKHWDPNGEPISCVRGWHGSPIKHDAYPPPTEDPEVKWLADGCLLPACD